MSDPTPPSPRRTSRPLEPSPALPDSGPHRAIIGDGGPGFVGSWQRVAGVDEAGRGPWAGPVVAAAVLLHRVHLPVRIDDSKRLTARQRAHAFRAIQANAEVGIGIVCCDVIDQRNILQATLHAMALALDDLSTPPDLVLVDGTMTPPSPLRCLALVRGDQRNYVISCASIIAKVVRDSLMSFYDRLVPHYGFKRHKGYGTLLHAQQLRRYGPSCFHRRSVRPVRELTTALQLVASARDEATLEHREWQQEQAHEPRMEPAASVAQGHEERSTTRADGSTATGD